MKKIVFLFAIAVCLTSCKTLVPFTENIQKSSRLDENTLKQIQFYTSSDIKLQRQVDNNQTTIESGKIKIIDGKEIEEIFIPENTPGIVVEQPDQNRLAVSFEIGDEYFLTFGVNPKRGDRFYLLAKEWKNKVGKVTYNSGVYFTTPESADVHLLVNMKKIKKLDKDQRVAGGRKL